MDKDLDKDLGKLGTVLSIHSNIIKNQSDMFKESLDMLKEQQKRQVRMIWSSIGIVALAIFLYGLSSYMIMSSVQNINSQLESHNKIMEAVVNVRTHNDSKEATQKVIEK